MYGLKLLMLKSFNHEAFKPFNETTTLAPYEKEAIIVEQPT
jgi:hypothetical protein